MEKLQKLFTRGTTAGSTSDSRINSKTIYTSLVIALISALLGSGCIFDEMYPFGFAMIMASPGIYSLAAFIGAGTGLVFSRTGLYLFRYLICAGALMIIRSRILTEKKRSGNVWIYSFASLLVICSVTGVAVVLPSHGSFDEILMFVSEGAIAAFTSFFYRRCIIRFTKENRKTFSSGEILCLYISFSTIIASFAGYNFYGFSPAEALSFFAIIFSSFILGESGGVLCACLCAAALSTDIFTGYNIFPIIFSGVISSVFSPLGKAGTSLSFLLAFAATSLFTTGENFLVRFISVCVACVVFWLIPVRFLRKISAFLKTGESSAVENNYRKDVSRKLSHTAEALVNICSGMNKVSENLKKIDSNTDRNIFCKIRNKVCHNCNNSEKCWQESFQYTLKGFDELAKNYHSGKSPAVTDFAKQFLKNCPHNKELVSSMVQGFRKHEESLREEIALDEKRQLISDQMQCMSDVLVDFSENFSRCNLVDNELSRKVKEIFNSFSIRCTKAVCIIDTDSNMTIKAYCKKIESTIDRKKLKEAIEQASFRKFNNADIDFTENGTVVIFKQKPWMKMKVGKIQISSEESPICGDCLKETNDEYGNRTIILSDGMGTGGRAAVDAAITAEYFSELLEGNISPDNALKIINSVLSVKSSTESLSTIDLAKINLFSGKAEFYKAGAAASFVRKNGKCRVIEGASLPAGILHDVSFAKENVTLSKGDIVVMVSDGVTNGSQQWLIDEIEKFNLSNPELLAQKIAGNVCEKSKGERRDDITVFVGIMTA